MSKFNRVIQWVPFLAIAVVAGTACSQSSSNNWNKMFGKDEGRRVEPQGQNAPNADRAAPGTTAAKSETASHDYATKDTPTEPTTADRGDPNAIQQYAANMNPPSHKKEPRIQANRAQPIDPSSNQPPPTAHTGGSNMSSASDTTTGNTSPVRMAADRPTNPSMNTPTTPPPGNSAPRSTQPRNAMFVDTGNAAGANTPTNRGGSLPTVESQAQPNQPAGTDPPASSNTISDGAPVIDDVTVRPAKRDPIAEARHARTGEHAMSNNATPKDDTDAQRRQTEIAAQQAKVAADPTDIEAQFKLRTMYLFDNRDDEAMAPIRGVTPDVQEIMLAQLRSMQAARSGTGRDPATWANRQLKAMQRLQEKLRARADLQVPKVKLCTEIKQFGVYTPFKSTDFKAGTPNDVLIYVEVDNFKSEKTPSGEYRTQLGARLTLMNDEGKELVSLDEPNIEDFSRGIRRDFFLAFGPITIPASLPVGDYVIKVEIEDKLADKINSNTTSLRLVP